MAKITPYQQGQIASSVVGTPGVNLSAAQTSFGLGSQLANIGAAQHQQYLTDMRAKQAEQRALEKHMQDMARQTEVTNIASGAQVEMQKSQNELQMKYRDNPGQAVQEYTQTAEQRIADTLGQVTDPETNMMLQQKLMSMHASNINSMGNWEQSRQVPIAEQNLRNSAGSLSITTGQMAGKTPQEVKDVIANYADSTKDQYKFFHAKGEAGQFDASSDAVKQYLDATAASGDPVLLEKRIKEFADGRFIAPDTLQGLAVQQRGIAAQVRMAQNTEQTKTNNATYLDTVQQLLAAGGGDMKAVNPAVAQEILNKAAPNLTTAHNVGLQEMISRNAIESKQRDASETALEMAITNPLNTTGKLENTPPSVIKDILKIPNLSPEDREKYTKLLTGNVASIKSGAIDKTLAASIGQSAAGVNRLADDIHASLANIGRIKDKAAHAQALADFGLNIQKYQDAYVSLSSAKNAIKDPNVKALVDLHVKNADQEFNSMVKLLQNEPNAIAMKKASTDMYQNLQPQTIYPDPRQQQFYNYLYKQRFYNFIQNKNFSADDLTKLNGNPKAMQGIKNILAKETASWMHQRGLTP